MMNAGYPYRYDDAGRARSSRPRQINDCTVRAVALTRRLAYDKAYDLLAGAGRKCSHTFHLGSWINQQAWATWMPFPAVKGRPRMNATLFYQEHPHGVYICRSAHHVFAVINGVVLDTTPVRDTACIYGAWVIEQDSTKTMQA